MSANETQIGGTHYTDMPIQPWDFMQSCMSREQFAGYLLGNVIKYAARHQAKGGIEDLRKARHYLDKLIEVQEPFADALNRAMKESLLREHATPAVSESAAGERGNVISRAVDAYFAVFAEAGLAAPPITFGEADVGDIVGVVRKAGPVAPSYRDDADWPGPDWSQAPEWAMWWAKDLSNTRHGCWFDKEPQCNEVEQESTDRYVRGGYWSLGRDGTLFKWSSEQGYTGNWRDSLRKRPE